jgi:hypothetical protein
VLNRIAKGTFIFNKGYHGAEASFAPICFRKLCPVLSSLDGAFYC